MENRELKVAVLKQARNLRGKTIKGNQNVFLSDDSPPSVREVRKKLLDIEPVFVKKHVLKLGLRDPYHHLYVFLALRKGQWKCFCLMKSHQILVA